MKPLNSTLLAAIATIHGLALLPSSAQNTFYAPGDLILYFQKEGGSNTVYANLGNAATLYRGTAAGPGAANKINFMDISATLTSAFGAGWASDPAVYAGLAAVWGSSATSPALQDGDPHRTLYVSMPRTAVGSVGQANSAGWDLTLAGNTAMTGGASSIFAQNNTFETTYNAVAVVSAAGVSTIDDQNPFLAAGVLGNAFNTFAGGVQQAGAVGSFGTLGAAGDVEFALDLYRILARTDVAGQIGGNLRAGSFEGTVTVNSSGNVSFISQGAAGSSYDTWIATFPTLTAPADKLPLADPDNDGLTNAVEFVLNGNPSFPDSSSVAPAIAAGGSDLVFSFNRRDDSEAGSTVTFQYGSDLAGWVDAPIGAAGSATGNATVVVGENGASADAISVTVPKSAAADGKLFARLKVVR